MIYADKQGEAAQKPNPCLGSSMPKRAALWDNAGSHGWVSSWGSQGTTHHLGQGTETNDVGPDFLGLEESTAKRKGTEKGNQLLRNLLEL